MFISDVASGAQNDVTFQIDATWNVYIQTSTSPDVNAVTANGL